MKVKLFNTRIDADTIVADQQAINTFMETVTVKSTATQFVNGDPDFWSILVFYEQEETSKLPDLKDIKFEEEELSETQQQLQYALKTWRKDRSNGDSIPEFMIISNAIMLDLAKTMPQNLATLRNVRGMTETKIKYYGDDILAICNAFV